VPGAGSNQSRIAKREKQSVRANERKAKLDAQTTAQMQVLASPVQPENPASADAAKSVDLEPVTNSAQPVPQPAVEQVNAASQPKTGGVEPKPPQLYLEVGTFKDETWANNAVDKLTQLGFHAVLIHKNVLWSQSYHVQVGPYTNQKDIAEARQSLAAQGFKAHPVN